MDTTLLMTGGLMAAAGTIVYQLKAIPMQAYRKVKSRMINSVRIYETDDLFDMLEKYLAKNYSKEYRDVEASVGNYVSDSKAVVIRYKQEENTFIFKYGDKRLIITKSKEKLDKAETKKDLFFSKYIIKGWKAKPIIDKFLQEVISYNKQLRVQNSVSIYTHNNYGEWYKCNTVKVKSLDMTILNESKKSYIVNDVDSFLSSEEWYMNASIPYKRGYCFYGPPGTGKTTLALALANKVERNIYCLNLNSLSDEMLYKYFASIGENAVLLIEDIDKVFSGRDNVKESSKVTFSTFINCLDGAFYKHGIITIITTNHIEKLDEALLRTGRMDVKVEIPRPSHREINEYYQVFYNLPLNIEGNFDLKMSDVQEICLQNKLCPELAKQELINKIIN